MRADVLVGPRAFQERAARCAPWIKKNILYSDYAAATSDNTAADVAIFTLPKNCGILATQYVRVANWDGSDNTSVPLVVGDSDVDRFLSSTEMCTDGTEILLKYFVVTAGGIVSTSAATTVNAQLSAVASENPSTLTAGSTDLYMFVCDFGIFAEGSSEED